MGEQGCLANLKRGLREAKLECFLGRQGASTESNDNHIVIYVTRDQLADLLFSISLPPNSPSVVILYHLAPIYISFCHQADD